MEVSGEQLESASIGGVSPVAAQYEIFSALDPEYFLMVFPQSAAYGISVLFARNAFRFTEPVTSTGAYLACGIRSTSWEAQRVIF